MPLSDYVLLVAVICLIVLYIHVAPVARKRWSIFAHLMVLLGGLYVLLIHDAGAPAFDGTRPSPHIFATICFWLVSVAMVEFRPVTTPSTGAAVTDPAR
jgi:4-hydroxybenzoate polyprenyltransferase